MKALVLLIAGCPLVLAARPGPPVVPAPPPGWVCSAPVIGPDALVNEYRTDLREHRLADPQRLLRGADFARQAEFLAYHASDSEVELRCLLFDRDDTVPEPLTAERLLAALPPDRKPTVVLHYFLGDPGRSTLAADPVLSAAGGAARLARMRREAIEAADAHSLPAEAFASFCVQASIHALSLERMLEQPRPAPLPVVAPLEEGGEDPALVEFWERHGVLATGGLAGATLLGGLAFLGLRRASYEFPEFEVEPRFGAAHAAGVGAVISFGDTTQSAGAQKARDRDPLDGC